GGAYRRPGGDGAEGASAAQGRARRAPGGPPDYSGTGPKILAHDRHRPHPAGLFWDLSQFAGPRLAGLDDGVALDLLDVDVAIPFVLVQLGEHGALEAIAEDVRVERVQLPTPVAMVVLEPLVAGIALAILRRPLVGYRECQRPAQRDRIGLRQGDSPD